MASAPAQSPQQQAPPGGIQNWRYSEFIKAVEEDSVEKVTFTPDGKRVLVADVDGNLYRLDALPNDPELLNDLTKHKVDITVLSMSEITGGTAGDLAAGLAPFLFFGGLLLLSQRRG